MMQVRAYMDGDLDKIKKKRLDRLVDGTNDAEYLSEKGLTWTIIDGDELLAVFGAMRIYPMVMYVWLVPSDNMRGIKRAIFLLKTLRQYLDELGRYLRIKRFNAQVSAENEENMRFMKALGFEQEFLQRNAGPCAKGDIAGFVLFKNNGRKK